MGKAPTRVVRSPYSEQLVAVNARAEAALDAVEKVLGVAPHVKADQVAGEQGAQDLPVPREEAEDVVGRKGDVEEEGERVLRQVPADARRAEHQLVVVDPHDPGVTGLGHDRRAEAFVHLLVGFPVPRIETGSRRQGVKKRPQGPIGEAVVVARHLRLAEEHGRDAAGPAPDRDALAIADVDAGPPHPGPAALAQHRLQCGHEATRGGPSLEPLGGAAEGEGQPVAGDDDRAVGLDVAFPGHRFEGTVRSENRPRSGRRQRGAGLPGVS
jgi:hypothetical protein